MTAIDDRRAVDLPHQLLIDGQWCSGASGTFSDFNPATEELLTRHHPQQISMEQVAAAAGVGKGTVFHRFGSRYGLMRALMQERAQDLEIAITTGPFSAFAASSAVSETSIP